MERRINQGLTTAQVLDRRKAFGPNGLPEAPRASPVRVFLRQFSSFLVLILILAAVIALLLGEKIDTLAILIVVLLNGILGFVQEWRAETALEALKKMLSPTALVIRDGREQIIAAVDVVPGDILLVGAGERVAADARVYRASALKADESVLTGESLALEKAEGETIFAGSTIVSGRAEAEVTATGPRTAFGEIAVLTGSVGEKTTNLQRRLGRLARQLGAAALGIAGGILLLGLALGRDTVEMMMTGLSLAVAIVPEGLPAVVTITLALGAAAMSRQNALARRLQAVETLGASTVICTDKTGTLTENKMTATAVYVPSARFTVTGTGYDPAGHIAQGDLRVRASDDPELARLLRAGATCTHARLVRSGPGWELIGEPTEGALVVLAMKGWTRMPDPDAELAETPFSSDRKRMSVVAMTGDGPMLFAKGAPETILGLCTRIAQGAGDRALIDDDRAAAMAEIEAMAARGQRVLALAERRADGAHDTDEQNLIFLGLAGLVDPPRPEVRAAVAAAHAAGIRICMITGDNPVTAAAIARQVGLPVGSALTGDMLHEMSDAALVDALRGDALFARTRPADKMRIVTALQETGEIVAMTGDGVNDAPALKKADIGVAMGIRGTDVAKDASDLVLLDDNFATIVAAIREGRRQFDNVRKFVRYLLSSNAGEVIALVLNILIGGPLIFLATQILWMNLITDGVTAVALGLEKSEEDQMKDPPRPESAPVLGRGGLIPILCFGAYTGLTSLWIFLTLLPHGVDLARTTAFTAMVVFEKVSVFAFRSLRQPCWHIGWFSNPLLLGALVLMLAAQSAAVYWPPLQLLLHTVPLGWSEWGMILTLALPLIVVPEVIKTGLRLRSRATARS